MNEKRNFDYKRLHPFKWYILENFPFLEDSIDVLTNYQLFCKLGEMYNKEIDAINTLGIQVEGITDWFDNLDVQEEVNKKLDEMAEDGTLAEIINQEIFTELDNRVTTLEDNVASTTDFLMGISFKATGTQLPDETSIIVSQDGINFSNFIIPDLYLRDPSIAYNSNNHKFYIASTPPTQTEYTFLLYESEDLINWTEHHIAITGYLENLKWAPDLYYDETNNKVKKLSL